MLTGITEEKGVDHGNCGGESGGEAPWRWKHFVHFHISYRRGAKILGI